MGLEVRGMENKFPNLQRQQGAKGPLLSGMRRDTGLEDRVASGSWSPEAEILMLFYSSVSPSAKPALWTRGESRHFSASGRCLDTGPCEIRKPASATVNWALFWPQKVQKREPFREETGCPENFVRPTSITCGKSFC